MRRVCLTVLVVSLASVSHRAPVVALVHCSSWARSYTAGALDGAVDVHETSAGFVVDGVVQSFGAGSTDAWMIKLDECGNVQQQRIVGGAGRDEAWRSDLTSDGGLITVGLGNSYFVSAHAPLVLKFDATGSLQQAAMYHVSNRDWGGSIKQTPDGGYVVAGGSDPSDSNQYFRGAIFKLDANANILWQHTYDTNLLSDIVQTPDGGYAAVGASSSSPSPTSQNATLLKVDAMGAIQWQKTYGGGAYDGFNSIRMTPDGGFIVGGQTRSFGAGGLDLWVLRLNSDGSVLWQKTYGGSGDEVVRSLDLTSDGGYVLAATTTSFGLNRATWALKLDGDGNIIWQRSYDLGSPEAQDLGAIRQVSDGGYILTSYAFFSILKLLPDGTIAGSCRPGLGVLTTALSQDTTVTAQDGGASPQAEAFSGGVVPLTSSASGQVANVVCGFSLLFPLKGTSPGIDAQLGPYSAKVTSVMDHSVCDPRKSRCTAPKFSAKQNACAQDRTVVDFKDEIGTFGVAPPANCISCTSGKLCCRFYDDSHKDCIPACTGKAAVALSTACSCWLKGSAEEQACRTKVSSDNSACSPGFLGGYICGYKGTSGMFLVNGNYSDPANGGTVLWYDGHAGFDYPADKGTEVYAAADGTVRTPASNFDLLYGKLDTYNALVIDHGNGYTTWYLHLTDHVGASGQPLKVGDVVKAGDLVGHVGEVGIGGGNYHLHFEVRKGAAGKPFQGHQVDPYGWQSANTDPYRYAIDETISLWRFVP